MRYVNNHQILLCSIQVMFTTLSSVSEKHIRTVAVDKEATTMLLIIVLIVNRSNQMMISLCLHLQEVGQISCDLRNPKKHTDFQNLTQMSNKI